MQFTHKCYLLSLSALDFLPSLPPISPPFPFVCASHHHPPGNRFDALMNGDDVDVATQAAQCDNDTEPDPRQELYGFSTSGSISSLDVLLSIGYDASTIVILPLDDMTAAQALNFLGVR